MLYPGLYKTHLNRRFSLIFTAIRESDHKVYVVGYYLEPTRREKQTLLAIPLEVFIDRSMSGPRFEYLNKGTEQTPDGIFLDGGPATFEHFKGGRYLVYGVATCQEEDGEQYVFYAPEEGHQAFFLRPLSEFTEQVERDGYSGPRFNKVNNPFTT
mgnify:CR=1 FL=1